MIQSDVVEELLAKIEERFILVENDRTPFLHPDALPFVIEWLRDRPELIEAEKLRADNDALRSALNEYRTKYWTLCDEVERLFKTIADEKREEGR